MNHFEEKFNNFLENLRNDKNSSLIDTITTGFNVINEALSTDDANAKKMGQPIHIAGAPAVSTTIFPNVDNVGINDSHFV